MNIDLTKILVTRKALDLTNRNDSTPTYTNKGSQDTLMMQIEPQLNNAIREGANFQPTAIITANK